MNKQEWLLVGDIMTRARKMGLLQSTQLSFMIDMNAVCDTIGLRLQDLVVADDFNFTHDVVGIQNNMGRSGLGRLTSRFVPRFAGKSRGPEWEDAVRNLLDAWNASVKEGLMSKTDMGESLKQQIAGTQDMSSDEKGFGDPDDLFTRDQWKLVVENAARRWLLHLECNA